MNKKFNIIITLLLLLVLASCTNYETKVLNGSFERGNLNDWEIFGNAFSNHCVTYDVKDKEGNNYNYVGDFFLCGEKNNNDLTGYIISKPFKLTGNGLIGFLIGGAKNVDKCYVALTDKSGKNILCYRANDEFDIDIVTNSLHRVILDGTKFVGQIVRIKIIDNDDQNDGYNYINVDDFIVNFKGKEDMVGKINEANSYINKNKDSINNRYRMSYHLMPEIGWCNDPNGFCFYQGKIHQFYQHNPYSSSWGPMHWGHATSDDFVKWNYSSIALAPDKPYDNASGCFSGSAIVDNGIMYLMYTGVDKDGYQQQCIAMSNDGEIFKKLDSNPVIRSHNLPKKYSSIDFRDPYIFKRDNYFYCIVGTKSNGYGQLVLFKSKDLSVWDFVGELLNNSDPSKDDFYQLPGVYECPSFALINNQEVLICSPQNLKQEGTSFQNIHSTVYIPGNLNLETGKFTYEKMYEIDGGFDFYAAQTMTMPDGRVVMTAWMDMWDRTYPTQGDGWSGSMILPRELSFIDGKLYQKPIKEIENYRTNYEKKENLIVENDSVGIENIEGNKLELILEMDVNNASKCGVKVFKDGANETIIYFDSIKGEIIIDRSNSGKKIYGNETNRSTRSSKINPIDGKIKLHILLDNISCEIFVNDGEVVMSSKIYSDNINNHIEFFADNGFAKFIKIEKYDIEIK